MENINSSNENNSLLEVAVAIPADNTTAEKEKDDVLFSVSPELLVGIEPFTPEPKPVIATNYFDYDYALCRDSIFPNSKNINDFLVDRIVNGCSFTLLLLDASRNYQSNRTWNTTLDPKVVQLINQKIHETNGYFLPIPLYEIYSESVRTMPSMMLVSFNSTVSNNLDSKISSILTRIGLSPEKQPNELHGAFKKFLEEVDRVDFLINTQPVIYDIDCWETRIHNVLAEFDNSQDNIGFFTLCMSDVDGYLGNKGLDKSMCLEVKSNGCLVASLPIDPLDFMEKRHQVLPF